MGEGNDSMTVEQLTEIVKTADLKAIHNALLSCGYIYCNKNKRFGKINVVDLFNGDEQQSEDFIDSKHEFIYDG